jgi:hypothetical protein
MSKTELKKVAIFERVWLWQWAMGGGVRISKGNQGIVNIHILQTFGLVCRETQCVRGCLVTFEHLEGGREGYLIVLKIIHVTEHWL